VFLALALASSVLGAADTSRRNPIDPKGEFAKLVGQVTQLPGQGSTVGNGFIVGPSGCFLITNFHVAFGKVSKLVLGIFCLSTMLLSATLSTLPTT